MSMEYIRQHYGIPAKRGLRIKFCGHPATITGSEDARLRIRIDGDDRSVIVHPTWRIEYPEVTA